MALKVNVIFYSMYGHVYRMAGAVLAGARQVAGTEVSLYQVAELAPDDVLGKSGAKAARAAFAHVPVAKVENLTEAQAIIFGTPTRFGNMCTPDEKFSGPNRTALCVRLRRRANVLGAHCTPIAPR